MTISFMRAMEVTLELARDNRVEAHGDPALQRVEREQEAAFALIETRIAKLRYRKRMKHMRQQFESAEQREKLIAGVGFVSSQKV